MRTKLRICLLPTLLLLLQNPCSATDYKNLEKALENQLQGRILILRGFPKDNKLAYDAELHPIQETRVGDWTNSQLRIDKVQAKGDSIVISGKHANAGDEGSPFSTGMGKVEITISGPFTQSHIEMADKIRNQLFLIEPHELTTVVPRPWIVFFAGMMSHLENNPYAFNPPLDPQTQALSDPAIVDKLANGEFLYRVKGDVKPPKAVQQQDPEYPEAARRGKYQGTVVLIVIIGKTGAVEQVFFARPAGMGLDYKALEAVKTWKFLPATKNGSPVACVVNVEMSFNLY
ncbi:MAG: outer rane transport energization protein TonB [Acidobacteriaceae bacterium]|nr:outer rane transport energization protein TonB [Acidobacteriaceae bacterium]